MATFYKRHVAEFRRPRAGRATKCGGVVAGNNGILLESTNVEVKSRFDVLNDMARAQAHREQLRKMVMAFNFHTVNPAELVRKGRASSGRTFQHLQKEVEATGATLAEFEEALAGLPVNEGAILGTGIILPAKSDPKDKSEEGKYATRVDADFRAFMVTYNRIGKFRIRWRRDDAGYEMCLIKAAADGRVQLKGDNAFTVPAA